MKTNSLVYAYLAAVFGIVGMELATIAVLRIYKVEIDQLLVGVIMGICTPTLVSLLAFIRGVGNAAAAEDLGKKVDMHHAAVEAKLAETSQLAAETKEAVAGAPRRPPLGGGMPFRNLP